MICVLVLALVDDGCYSSSGEGRDVPTDSAYDLDQDDCEQSCEPWAECGDDGCGGSCGTCLADEACGTARVCVPAPCAPAILIPAGIFLMGSDSLLPPAPPRWSPMHRVSLSSYLIAPCEVTNAEYGACVAAGACSPPYRTDSLTRMAYFGAAEYRHYPVIAVDWGQSDAYCRWVGGRLPSEAMWAKAARGGCELRGGPDCTLEDTVDWPWGSEEPTCDRANTTVLVERDGGPARMPCVGDPMGPGDTDRVGARSDGASVYGVLDMTGNVREWTSDWYTDGDDYRDLGADPEGVRVDPEGPDSGTAKIQRGSSFGGANPLWFRDFWPPVLYPESGGGFRCTWAGE